MKLSWPERALAAENAGKYVEAQAYANMGNLATLRKQMSDDRPDYRGVDLSELMTSVINILKNNKVKRLIISDVIDVFEEAIRDEGVAAAERRERIIELTNIINKFEIES